MSETKAIKAAIKQVCDKFKVEHCALLSTKAGLIACTKGWQQMHEADRVLLSLVCKSEQDCPVHLTHTSLNEDANGIGRVAYRLVTVSLSEEHLLCLISDSTLDLEALKTVSFDYSSNLGCALSIQAGGRV